MAVGAVVAHQNAGDVRPRFGKRETIHHQDGAIESIAREDGLQVLRRVTGREANVGVYAQKART